MFEQRSIASKWCIIVLGWLLVPGCNLTGKHDACENQSDCRQGHVCNLNEQLCEAFEDVPEIPTARSCEPWADYIGWPSSKGSPPHPTDENSYVVNDASFDNMPSISRDEGLQAVLRSAEQWNAYGTAGWFRYAGTTGVANLLSSDGTCSAVPHNLVVVDPSCDSGSEFNVVCDNSRWVLRICSSDVDWRVGEVLAGQLDLNASLTHEFGHALGLWHPGGDLKPCTEDDQCSSDNCSGGRCEATVNGEGTAAVMMPTTSTSQLTPMRQRHLFPADIECLESISGRRSVTLKAHRYMGGPTFTSYTAKNGVVRGGGLGLNLTGTEFATISYDRYHRMGPGYREVPTNTSFLNSLVAGIGPSTAWWLDSRLRFFYNTNVSTNRFVDWTAAFDVFQFNYDSALSPGNVNSEYMEYCTSAACSPVERMKSGFGISWSHNQTSGDMVVAWAQQDRGPDNNRALVSVGTTDFRVNLPTDIGVVSETGVQVACGETSQAVGANDCLLVYTDGRDGLFRVRVRPFVVNDSAIGMGQEIITGLVSATETAAWFSYDKFWIALKSTSGDVHVYSSASGSSWSFVQNLGTSITPPRVASLNVAAHGDDGFIVYTTQGQ